MKNFLLRQGASVLKVFLILICLFGSAQLFAQGGFIRCYADRDRDGFGNPNDVIEVDITFGGSCGGVDGFRVGNALDCDDADKNAFPGQVWYKDLDDDGISTGQTITQCFRPFGYKTLSELKSNEPICSLLRDAIHTIDCDDFVKNDVNTDGFKLWFVDNDGDGFIADKEHHIFSCSNPIILPNNPLPLAAHYVGFATTETELCNLTVDCNDNDPLQKPNQEWYFDRDGDGFPQFSTPERIQCENPGPLYKTKDQLTSLDEDCDDDDNTVYPKKWYRDKDGDGYTDGTILVQCGSQPVGYILSPQMFVGQPMIDCDDNNIDVLANQRWLTDPDMDGYISVGYTLVKQCSKPAGNWISLIKLLETGAAFFIDPTQISFFVDCNGNDALEHPNQNWYPDMDGDGYPGSTVPEVQCSRKPGYKVASELLSSTNVDCNDNESLEHPGQVWYVDSDNDGYSTLSTLTQCTRPLFYKAQSELKSILVSDCNDRDAMLNPETKWYFDTDNDGYYGSTVSGCSSPGTGYTTTTKGPDCNDDDATINPETEWYQDADNDGYYTSIQIGGRKQCTSPGQGWRYKGLLGGGDCNDNDAAINPATIWYKDSDGDGYSDALYISQPSCTSPGGSEFKLTIKGGGDCNDNDATINPETVWYLDADNDGYYTGSGVTTCQVFLSGYKKSGLLGGGDCNDNNATINPATIWILDADADGYYPGSPVIRCTSPGSGYMIKSSQLPGDCLDNNASVNPAAVEVCGNRIDDNCNGLVDEGTCATCGNATNLKATSITSTSTQISWSSVANPVQWQLQYKTTKPGSKWVDVLLTGNLRTYKLSSLSSNQNYLAQIRAKCGNTWTSYSVAVGFKTLAGGGSLSLTNMEANPALELNAEGSSTITLHPNPTNGRFMLRLNVAEKINGKTHIQLIDITGKTVHSENAVMYNGALQKTITLSSTLAKGMYMVRVAVNNKTYKTPLVYEK